MDGALHRFFTKDHNRLDELFDRATADPDQIQMEDYQEFRKGILTHIKMEEKIFFPAAQSANGGVAVPMAARLRLDHAALTSLMVVFPTPDVIKVIRSILEIHDEAEEEPGGMYDICEKLTKNDVDILLEKLSNVSEVPLNPINSKPFALDAAKRTMKRAGYDFDEIVNSV